MILLDTHILIWLLITSERLLLKNRRAILAARRDGGLAISAISLWEIAWLAANQRIEIGVSIDAFIKKCASYVRVFPITPGIAVRSVGFPDSYPGNPQDRILGATALAEGLRLLTHDKRIRKSRLIPLAV